MEREYFQNELTKSSRHIHTASAFVRSSGLPYLQEVGELMALAPHTSSRSNLPSYLFFIVTDGAGSFKYLGKDYELTVGDAVFIDCRNGYSQRASDHKSNNIENNTSNISNNLGEYDSLWSLSWCHFDAVHMNVIYKKYEERGGLPVFHLSEERMREYKSIILRTYSTATSMSYTVDMALGVLLTEMLEMLMQDAWSNRREDSVGIGTIPNGQIPAEIKSYIEENYREKLTLEVIAKRFYINKQYLARIFQKAYGISVGDHIANVRISAAKEMLRFTNMRIEEIGASVGIEDPNYFARVFKRVEGISPKQYRESW